MDITAIIVAIMAALFSGGGVFLWRAQHHKTEAEADKQDAEASAVVTATALNMVKRWEVRVVALETRVDELEADRRNLRDQVESLSKRVACLESENTNLRAIHAGAKMLENQVVGLGEEPVFKVPAQV